MPLWRVVKPWTEWILIIFPKPGQTYDTPTYEEWMEIIRETIGDDSIKAEIANVSRWQINETYAEHYSKGNVFCLGDAVHRHPPTGGLGSNTCIQDSYNLAWKLAFVLKGLGSPSLLNTFSTERQPVGKAVMERANDALAAYAPIFDSLGVMHPTAADRKHTIDALAAPHKQGAQLRKQMRDALLKVGDCEMQALGMEMGQLYPGTHTHNSAFCSREETKPFKAREKEAIDSIAFYTPSTYPGRRLPHAWLDQATPSGVISTLDLAGKGAFCLFTGPGGAAWKNATKSVSLRLGGVPLNAYSIGFRQDWEDVYGDWARTCAADGPEGIEEDGCVLVRPDLFVAWRSGSLTNAGEHEAGLERAMRAILHQKES
jgi:hypothetical protein